MTVRGEVAGDGSFRELPDDADRERSSDLQLVQEDGEWRIANPDPGILIDDFSFDREYQPRNVFFFDPRFEVLVPDVVYLPRTANDATATLLARKVLAGPTDWLAPAVVTAFPEDAELGIDSVPVRNGVATVDLSAQVALAGPEERERMAAQLIWTLGALPEVEAVEVQVTSGAPLAQDEPLTPRDPQLNGYDPAVLKSDTPLFAVGDAGVVRVADGELTPVAGPLGDLPGIREVAVNLGGHRAVVITGDGGTGTQVQAASFGEEEQLETLFQGVDLASLSWDRTGLVWAVDHGVQGPGLVVTQPDGQPLEVELDQELAGGDITRLAVSPDGARVALVADEVAQVANVIRDPDAGTVSIVQPRRIGPASARATDVAWSSSSPSWSAADAVVVLAESQAAGAETPTAQPYLATLSGQEIVPRGLRVEDGVRVAGSPGLPVVLESGDGELHLQRSSNTWIDLGPARSPAYPG
nr:LpqB family beta-propeller domain-containing protein [Jiangella mangrovi]